MSASDHFGALVLKAVPVLSKINFILLLAIPPREQFRRVGRSKILKILQAPRVRAHERSHTEERAGKILRCPHHLKR